MPRPLLSFLLLFAAPASVLAALCFGSADLPAAEALRGLFAGEGLAHDIVWQLRLPRALAAFACGGLLALAGALLQVLLRNPLADPYVLGISGGAALGALSAMLWGLGLLAGHALALGGALMTTFIVFGLSFRSAEWNSLRLLLTGVVLASGCGALISLILALAPQAMVKGMLFWLMGDLSHAGTVWPAWLVLGAVLALAMSQAGRLNVLHLGQLKAATLGVAVLPLQIGVYFGAAAATVAAVLLGGSIGFVGMMVPHALRLLGVVDQRRLLPFAVLLGGSLLVLADTLARTLWAPQQLPVGVLTALLGVPFLLWLLGKR
ncbi:MAG: iron ABC transporter permease [Pseudomonadota bacterium]